MNFLKNLSVGISWCMFIPQGKSKLTSFKKEWAQTQKNNQSFCGLLRRVPMRPKVQCKPECSIVVMPQINPPWYSGALPPPFFKTTTAAEYLYAISGFWRTKFYTAHVVLLLKVFWVWWLFLSAHFTVPSENVLSKNYLCKTNQSKITLLHH